MIRIYCRLKHICKVLCDECLYLDNYTENKLSKCPIQEEKPTCNNCRLHCYQISEKEKIKEIMQFSGLKMIFNHQYLSAMHIMDRRKEDA